MVLQRSKKWMLIIGAVVFVILLAAGIFWLVWSNSPEFLTQKGDSFLYKKEYTQAQEVYSSALEKDSDYLPACLGLARSLYEGGKPNEAIELLKGWQEEEPVALLAEYQPTHSISLEAGTYRELKEVTLSSEQDASIYYTLDGTIPTEQSEKYEGPIQLPVGKSVLSVVAIRANGAIGQVERREYFLDLRVPDPVTADPVAGIYEKQILVQLSAYPGDCIYYTLDGSEPTVKSIYYGPDREDEQPKEGEIPPWAISLTEGIITLKAISVTEDGVVSETAVFEYDLTDLIPDPVSFSLSDGNYIDSQVLTLTAEKNTVIYYTTDGTEPTIESDKYTAPISLNVGFNGQVRAIAVSSSGKTSDTAVGRYTVSQAVQNAEGTNAGSQPDANTDLSGTGNTGFGGNSSKAENISTTTSYQSGLDCASLANNLRAALGLSTLTVDSNLMQAAQQRAYEMVAYDCYGHTRPNGSSYNTVGITYGFGDYGRMCENIAMVSWWGTTDYSLDNVVTGSYWYNKWKNSSAHYQNMTRTTVTRIGVGVAYKIVDGVTYVMASMLLL